MSVEFVRLKNRAHLLPFNGHPGRYLAPEGEIVDTADPFWAVAIADGSVEIVRAVSSVLPPDQVPPLVATHAQPANPTQE